MAIRIRIPDLDARPARWAAAQRTLWTVAGLALVLTACGDSGPDYTPEPGADARGHTPPTRATARANAVVRDELPLADQADFEAARRGLIARDKNLQVRAYGEVVWDMPAYDFMDG